MDVKMFYGSPKRVCTFKNFVTIFVIPFVSFRFDRVRDGASLPVWTPFDPSCPVLPILGSPLSGCEKVEVQTGPGRSQTKTLTLGPTGEENEGHESGWELHLGSPQIPRRMEVGPV